MWLRVRGLVLWGLGVYGFGLCGLEALALKVHWPGLIQRPLNTKPTGLETFNFHPRQTQIALDSKP